MGHDRTWLRRPSLTTRSFLEESLLAVGGARLLGLLRIPLCEHDGTMERRPA